MAILDKVRWQEQRQTLRRKEIIIFALHFLVTPYSAYMIHQFTELVVALNQGQHQELSIHLNWNYFQAWYLLVIKHVPGMVFWWAVSEVVFLVFMVSILLRPRPTISNVRQYKITDHLSIPVPAGNGQFGTDWFASKEDENRLMKTLVIENVQSDKELKERPGLVVNMERDKNGADQIRYLSTFAHSIIVALTGAGKTRRVLLPSICLQIMAGDCIVVSDVKGEIYYYTSDFAKKHGYKICVIDLVNPAKSDHYNFLQPIIDALDEGKKKQNEKIEKLEREIIEAGEDLQLIGLLYKKLEFLKKDYSWTALAQEYTWDLVSVFVGERKGEPLWFNGETATIAACILAICLEAPEECWNLYNVYSFIAYMAQENPETKKSPLSLYLDQLADNHPAKMIFMQSQIASERTRTSFYTSALGTLRLFTNPLIAEMSSSSDFKLDDIGQTKTALYLIIPDEKKTYYPIASVLINQMYIAQVSAARKNGGKLKIPTDYNLDELANFPTIPVLPNIVAVGRSRGIRANLIIQDYQQLQAKYEKDFETIKTQCGLKIFLRSDNEKTLKEFSATTGMYTVETTSASISSSTNLRSSDTNISNSSNLTGRELLKPSEIEKIKAPFALVKITSESVLMTQLPDLSQYHFNKMLGLGDEIHNNELIERRERMRPEREYKDVPLWGIWNTYKALLEETKNETQIEEYE